MPFLTAGCLVSWMLGKKMFQKILKRLGLITIFAIAMGFVEAMVVVYSRAAYYPSGFAFPLNMLVSDKMLFFEWLREAAAIIMLLVIAIIAGRNFLQRFSYFIYSFAVWDIFYYLGLKLVLNWPQSFLTWDLLFLIPVTWIGPVLAPIICSLTMILLALLILYLQKEFNLKKLKSYEWGLIGSGAFIIFITFVWDYSKIIISRGFLPDFFSLLANEGFREIVSNYIPTYYGWPFFIIGEILILCGMGLLYKRMMSA